MDIRRLSPAAPGHPTVVPAGSLSLVARSVALALALVLVAVVAAGTPQRAAAAPPVGAAPLVVPEALTFETIADHDELTGEHATLFRLYWAFFGRSPDPGGALYWIEQRDRCVGLESIAGYFAESDEFAARYGHLDDAAFIEVVYRNVLGRTGDPGGVKYWTGLLTRDGLSRGGVVLHVSLSAEFVAGHAYPSDGVPARGCRLAAGASGRAADVAIGQPLATVGGVTLMAPAAVIERAGFHQSSHPGALAMTAADPRPVRLTTLASRGRGTHRRTAVDIVTEPSTAITAPVTGTVVRAGGYSLYCRYRDSYLVIKPDADPRLEVKLLHIQDVNVVAGQRVQAGDRVASNATMFPFRSQIDRLTAEPSWPHVHIEVVDPSIPRKGSSGSC